MIIILCTVVTSSNFGIVIRTRLLVHEALMKRRRVGLVARALSLWLGATLPLIFIDLQPRY